MAAWAKKNEALIERIDTLLSAAPVQRRNFFGNVSWFLNSNDLMFAGAWGDGVIIRVGEERFDPSGHRPKREYVYLDAQRIAEDDTLLDWLDQASAFVGTLRSKK